MNYQKGFAVGIVLLIVLGLVALGGAGYVAMNPEVIQTLKSQAVQKDDSLQTEPGDHPEVDHEANEGIAVSENASISWRFADAGEANGMPYTNVTVVVNGTAHEMGKFLGSCSEVKANGGVDGKGLLAGEISAAQCWFAGGGNEIGVFGHEDGGVEIMVGDLSEGAEGTGLFRGDFEIKNTIRF